MAGTVYSRCAPKREAMVPEPPSDGRRLCTKPATFRETEYRWEVTVGTQKEVFP